MKEKRWMRCYYALRSRCRTNPRYAGRGIKALITPKELEFLWKRDGADKMKVPSLDRIDNDGNYEILNCRFVERIINSSKSNNKDCKLGITKAIAIKKEYKKGVYGRGFKALARKYGVNKRSIIFIAQGKMWNEPIRKLLKVKT